MSHALIEGVLPQGVAVAWSAIDDDEPALFVEEQALVTRAVPKRRREFAHGRACARRALAELGARPSALLAAETRDPLWPAGFVGSISHDRALSVAVVARSDAYAGLGVDVEPDEPLSTQVAARIWSPEEASAAVAAGVVPEASAAKLVFVLKEAVYKCQFAITRTFLGFSGARITLGPGTFEARLTQSVGPLTVGTRLTGRWRREGGELFGAAWREP
jgi:4'-phosphopantetheinyl transferase EntD